MSVTVGPTNPPTSEQAAAFRAAFSSQSSLWTVTADPGTLVHGQPVIVTAAVTMELPETLVVGRSFIVAAVGFTVQIDPGDHTIEGANGSVSGSDTLAVSDGETVTMVAMTTGKVRIV
jgi:hypothetical protein